MSNNPTHRATRALLAAALSITLSTRARADTFRWVGTSSANAWSDPANWVNQTTPGQTPAAYPTDADTAVLDTGGYDHVDLVAPTLTLDTLQLPSRSTPFWFGPPPQGSLPYTLSSSDGTGATLLRLNQITAGPSASFGPGGFGNPNILDPTVTLQGPDASPLSISLHRDLAIQGRVIAPGGITLPTSPSFYDGGTLTLSDPGNVIPSIDLAGSLYAYGPGSIHNATINLRSGPFAFSADAGLTLVSDLPVADYGNDINLTGVATLHLQPATAVYQPFGNPASSDFRLGNLTLTAALFDDSLLRLTADQSHDTVQFQSLDITGPATLAGQTANSYGPRTVARFSTLIGHPVSTSGLFLNIGPTSLTIDGGEVDVAGAGAFPAPITIKTGLLVVQSDGALGTGPILVNAGGALRFDAPQSNLPPITIDAGGALGGDLTGATYGANVSLADGAILFPTAGPLPARPAAGPVLWRGIDSLTATFTVGDDASSSVYRGAAFGPFTPDGPFTGSINEAAPGAGIQLLITGYTAIGDPVSHTPATFNSTKDVTITLTGPNEVDLLHPLAGSARVFDLFAPPEFVDANPGAGTFTLLGPGVIPAGDTLNLKTGQLYITDAGDAVADGATVNVFPGARLSESDSGALSTGTFHILPGGVLSLRLAEATGGAHFLFDPRSIVELQFGISDPSWLPPQADIAIGYGVDHIGAGLQLAPNQRLTTLIGGYLSNTPVTPRPDAPADATFLFTAARARTLTFYNPVTFSPGQTLQIGDNAPSLYDDQIPTGTVNFAGNLVNVDHLDVVTGTLLLSPATDTPAQLNANTVIIRHGATLAGAGTLNANALTLAGSLTAGPSPATLQLNSPTTLLPGSSIQFPINSTSPLPGPGVAWSLLLINGPLTIDPDAPANPILLSPMTLSAAYFPSPDLLPDFDPALPYAFPFLRAASITGFDPRAFALDLSQFYNPYDGTWSVQQSSPTELDLVYAPPIPEPAAALIAAALLPLRRRRSRHSS